MIAELLIVIATCYHATPAQCNADNLTTADGTKIVATDTAYDQRILAVSRDLLEDFPMGSKIEIKGCSVEEYNGSWQIHDVMNKRHTGMIDFLINPGMPLLKEQVTLEIWIQ